MAFPDHVLYERSRFWSKGMTDPCQLLEPCVALQSRRLDALTCYLLNVKVVSWCFSVIITVRRPRALMMGSDIRSLLTFTVTQSLMFCCVWQLQLCCFELDYVSLLPVCLIL